MKDFFKNYKAQLHAALDALSEDGLEALFERMDTVRRAVGVVYVLGNGGSAAAAGHWVCDFAKGASVPGQPRMKIVSPVDNVSILTALGNDVSYDEVFSSQLENFLTAKDMVISLSVSGSSPDLVRAHELAGRVGAFRAAVSGAYHGKLETCSELVVEIPSQNYGVVEDLHVAVDHMLSQYLRLVNERAAAGQASEA